MCSMCFILCHYHSILLLMIYASISHLSLYHLIHIMPSIVYLLLSLQLMIFNLPSTPIQPPTL